MSIKRLLIVSTGIGAITGGVIWIVIGMIIAKMPLGIPGVSYRSTFHLMPWLGTGVICIALGLIGIYLSLKDVGKFVKSTFYISLFGSLLYFCGVMIRQQFNGAWEPAQPIGFILFIFGLLLFGIGLLRSKGLPKFVGMLILFSSIFLFLFNDQFITAWSSLPFGVIWIVLGFRSFVFALKVSQS